MESLQNRHRYGFWSVCICMWNLRLDNLLNALPHTLQGYGFSPVWMSMWFRKLPFWWKPLSHVRQTNSFCLLWVRICVLSVDERLNDFAQTWHVCGRSFVWIILWRQSVLDKRNDFPHVEQANGFCDNDDDVIVWEGLGVPLLLSSFSFFENDVKGVRDMRHACCVWWKYLESQE